MTTNAQAALQAAATVYSGGRGHTAPEHVKGMAAAFKLWLDNQDRAEARVAKEQADKVYAEAYGPLSRGAVPSPLTGHPFNCP